MTTTLQDACLRLAAKLYPGGAIEAPAMVMRDVYEHLTYLHEPVAHVASPACAWYAAAVPNPGDAVFSIGLLHKPAAGS